MGVVPQGTFNYFARAPAAACGANAGTSGRLERAPFSG